MGNQNAFRFLVEVAGGKFAKHKAYSQNLGTQLQPNFLGGERVNSRLMTMINDLFFGRDDDDDDDSIYITCPCFVFQVMAHPWIDGKFGKLGTPRWDKI